MSDDCLNQSEGRLLFVVPVEVKIQKHPEQSSQYWDRTLCEKRTSLLI